MWFDEDIEIIIGSDVFVNVSGVNEFSQIDIVEVDTNEDVIIVQTSESTAPVQSVNGKIGFVHLDKSDVGLSNVDNLSITGVSGYLQDQINQLDTGYASQVEIDTLSGIFDQKINLLSGEFDENNILGYTLELNSGIENLFVPYPALLNERPSSVTCSLQNFVDNVIYHYMIGQTTMSGFFINFSDVLTNSGYLLNVKIKK
jgi:hypothetical protein